MSLSAATTWMWVKCLDKRIKGFRACPFLPVPAISVPAVSVFFVQSISSTGLCSGMISPCKMISFSSLEIFNEMISLGWMAFLFTGVFITAAALLAAGRRNKAERSPAVG